MDKKESLGQLFLSNLSHEIRTPLNGIVGYTQLLSKTKLDTNQKIYVNSINKCCIQLVEFVNDIMDFSRLTNGECKINNEYFTIKELIDQIDSTIIYKIKEKNQKCHYQINPDIPEYIVTDKQKLLQILINLISNASKFTQSEGRIIVSFSINNEMLYCTVEDNGIGISIKDQEKIFNPFIQIQESLTKNGSGLGLAICKKLINFLGGEITVESEKNEGSIFRFNIKCSSFENFRNNIEKNTHLFKNKFILIVDDNLESRINLSDIFFEFNSYVVACSSYKEALKLISCKRYPLCVCIIDLQCSGIELAKDIKQIDSNLPIIGLCSTEENLFLEDFEIVLQKPINKIKVLDTVIKIIQKNDVEQYELNNMNQNNSHSKILIVDDIFYNTELLKDMIVSLGYKNVDVCNSGSECINLISANNYAILFLDLKMPDIDGFQVAEYIKTHNKNINIVVVTASVEDSDKEKCKKLDIKYFLLKPLNLNHIKTILSKI